jgi:hypothetical protein
MGRAPAGTVDGHERGPFRLGCVDHVASEVHGEGFCTTPGIEPDPRTSFRDRNVPKSAEVAGEGPLLGEVPPKDLLACPHAESTEAWNGGTKVALPLGRTSSIEGARELFQREPDS